MRGTATLQEMVEAFRLRGEAPAIIAFRGDAIETWSYARLGATATALARGLAAEGMARAEPVGILAPNSPEWVAAFFAIVSGGGLAVPLDPALPDADLVRVLRDSGLGRIFAASGYVARLRALDAARGLRIVVLDDGGAGGEGTRGWRGLARESSAALAPVAPDDPAALVYTSGTTGSPKGVVLSHRNFVANVEALQRASLADSADRVLLPLPLHHAYPFTVGLLGSLASGGAVVFPNGLSGPEIVRALRLGAASVMIGVPRLYEALVGAIEAKAAQEGAVAHAAFRLLLRLSIGLRRRAGVRVGRALFAAVHRDIGPNLRLLSSGGAKLEPELEWTLEGLGWRVLTGYGLTEAAPILTFNPPGRARVGTAGLPVAGVEIRIDRPAGAAEGEILARGPNVFVGYWKNADATRAAFTPDGWLRTGDFGHRDASGYLVVSGRLAEVIVLPDGRKVDPESVEATYALSPYVREVAVLVQDGRLAALVAPDYGALRARGMVRWSSLLREEMEFFSTRLRPHERASGYVVTADSLPRTPLGKLRRHLLPALYQRSRSAVAAEAPSELSEADRALLESRPARELWDWLRVRFPGRPFGLDSSPQLDLGMDSLEWVKLTLELQDRFGIALAEERVARVATVRDLLRESISAGEMPRRPAASAATAASALGAEQRYWLTRPGPVLGLMGLLLYAVNRLTMRGLFRMRVAGACRLPSKGPVLLAPNHSSYLDPFVLAAALGWWQARRTYWAGWSGKMMTGPIMRLFSRVGHVLPVDPDRGPASALSLGAAALGGGAMLIWFPEGRRSPTGMLNPFLPGVGVLIRTTAVPAVPVRIEGTFEALPRGRTIPRLSRVRVTFGEPLDPATLEAAGEGDSPEERIASALHAAVARLSEGTGAGTRPQDKRPPNTT